MAARGGIHLAIHDSTPAHWSRLRELDRLLRGLGVERYTMLVIPDYHGDYPLERHPDFCGWLRELQEAGVDMMLHGFAHGSATAPSGCVDRFRAALFTRGEGEFLALDRVEAMELLRRGRTVLAEAAGIETDAFVAPAWLAGRGTLEALMESGFRYTENRFRAWDPVTGDDLLRSPVLNFAGGSSLKQAAAAAWVRAGSRMMTCRETIRFALHPCDLDRRERLEGALAGLLEKRTSVLVRRGS